MAAVALLKFEQGVNVGASGQALKGVVGELVSVRNSVNTSVASWQMDWVRGHIRHFMAGTVPRKLRLLRNEAARRTR